eukprot:gene5282-5518_t
MSLVLQIKYLSSIGLQQDEICNMSSISVVLLGLNPETRVKPVVEYCKARGVADGVVPELVLQNPRIFEYKMQQLVIYQERPGTSGSLLDPAEFGDELYVEAWLAGKKPIEIRAWSMRHA